MRNGYGLLTGVPIPEIRLRIIPDRWGQPIGPFVVEEFTRLSLAPQQIGEIVTAGDHVLKGYLNGHGDAETKFKAGNEIWHRTGDAGKFDEQGRLWLVGRCSAKVRDAHGEIYPFSVECVAMEHPEIQRAAFVIHASRRILALENRAEMNSPALQALREDLSWACLSDIRILKHLPVDKRHNAKIDYPSLKQLLEKV